MATIVFKRGDTFSAVGTLKDATGAPQDLTGVVIAARLSWADGTTADLDITLLTQSGATLGQYTLVKAYASAASWSLGVARCDIQYTFPDATRRSTETLMIQVTEDITP